MRINTDADGGFVFSSFCSGSRTFEVGSGDGRGDAGRKVLLVVGGLLARQPQQGRLEFRQVLEGQTMIAAIHDFGPRLPWLIYRMSQALVHEWVMHRFRRYLKKLGRR